MRGVILSDESLRIPPLEPSTSAPVWADNFLDELRPLVSEGDRFECTASYLLDGRALFLTALGPQSPDHSDVERVPLTYLLVVQRNGEQADSKTVVNKRELGRLVDRLHLIGTVRLAALLDLNLLRHASAQLSQIDNIMKVARDAIETFQPTAGEADLIGKLENARIKLNNIINEFLTSPQNIASVGISYRIESSRYNHLQFSNNLAPLRILRVEGYQTYDEFVERRLGSTFDFISRLGDRFERAVNALARLDQSYASVQSHRAELQSRSTTDSIEEIQRYGELLLISVLVPYYLLNLLLHVFSFGSFEPQVAAGLIATLMSYGLNKFVSKDKRLSDLQKANYSTAIVCGYVISMICTVLILPQLPQKMRRDFHAQHVSAAEAKTIGLQLVPPSCRSERRPI